MNSASSAAPLRTLRRTWFRLALISVAMLLIAYAMLRTGWNPQSASRWITLAALIAIYQLWVLWSGIDTNHRPGEATVLSSLGAGTLATATRGLLLSMTAGFLFSPRPTGGLAWAPMVLFTSAITLDYMDGHLARRSNHVTVLGQRYDLELDSLGILIGSLLAIWYQVLPWFFIIFGLASYLFRFGLWMRERTGSHNHALPESRSRRPIAGLTMGYLSAMLWPIVDPLAGMLAGLLFLVPFGASFSRDWLVVSGALDPNNARYQAARRSAKALLLDWPRKLRPRHLLWLGPPILLWLVLRNVPLDELLTALSRLQPIEIVLLTLVNVGVVLTFSGRWWSILVALGYRLAYILVSAYRLAAFSVSYFTPGPQVGGEPVQVYLINKRDEIPLGTATASVVMEKALEFLTNFAFLTLGIFVTSRLELLSAGIGRIVGLISLGGLALAIGLLTAIWAGWWPLTRLISRFQSTSETLVRIRAVVEDGEKQLTALCRERPWALGAGLAFSLLSWLVLLVEYWLALRFLGLELEPAEVVVVVTAARLAILLPFPGGLGALEASQLLALSALGFSAAEGAAMGLLIRARDLLFGGVGLFLTARFLSS